jgi:uncharacterized protein
LKSRAWLEAALSNPELVRFAWLTLWAFVRIATSPRVFERPFSSTEAAAAISSWLAPPTAGVAEPSDHHWDILRSLMREGQASGPLIMDAALAAIATEHGATLCTTGRDFARFPGLKWSNPPRCRSLALRPR